MTDTARYGSAAKLRFRGILTGCLLITCALTATAQGEVSGGTILKQISESLARLERVNMTIQIRTADADNPAQVYESYDCTYQRDGGLYRVALTGVSEQVRTPEHLLVLDHQSKTIRIYALGEPGRPASDLGWYTSGVIDSLASAYGCQFRLARQEPGTHELAISYTPGNDLKWAKVRYNPETFALQGVQFETVKQYLHNGARLTKRLLCTVSYSGVAPAASVDPRHFQITTYISRQGGNAVPAPAYSSYRIIGRL